MKNSTKHKIAREITGFVKVFLLGVGLSLWYAISYDNKAVPSFANFLLILPLIIWYIYRLYKWVRKWNYSTVRSNNARRYTIKQVRCTQHFTAVDMQYKSPRDDSWIRAVPEAHIIIHGHLYYLTGSVGITMSPEKTYLSEGEIVSYTLLFPPIPETTEKIDLISGDAKDAAKWYGIPVK